MGGTRKDHIEWANPDPERQTVYSHTSEVPSYKSDMSAYLGVNCNAIELRVKLNSKKNSKRL